MADVNGLVNDKDFQALDPASQRQALARVSGDDSFSKLSDADTSEFVRRMSAGTNNFLQPPSGQTAISAAPKPFTGAWLKQKFYNLAVPGANYLPAAGSTAGAVIGGTAGTVEPGGGNALGAMGGAGVGGMAGDAAKQLFLRAIGWGGPATAAEASKEIAGQGLMQAGIQGVSELLPFLAPSLRNAALTQYGRALAPTKAVNKAITSEIAPEMIQRGVWGNLDSIAAQAGENAEKLNPQLDQAYADAMEKTARRPIRGLLPAAPTEIPLGAKPVPPEMPGQLADASQMPRKNVLSGAPPPSTQQIGPAASTVPARIYRPMYSTGSPELPQPEEFSGPGVMQTRDPAIANKFNPPSGTYPKLPNSYVPGAGKQILSDLENLKSNYVVEGEPANPTAVNAINGVQNIVRQYGNDISPNSLRKLKGIFDEPVAERGGYAGNDLATSYSLKAQKAAANSIRGIMSQASPNIAALNKEITFWLRVQDVVGDSALRQTGQAGGLLKTLAPLAAGSAGAVTGLHFGTAAGLEAGAGATLSAMAVQAIRSPAWRTASAVLKDRFADALARGSVTDASALLAKFGIATPAAMQSQKQTNPTLPWQRQQQQSK